MRSLFENRALWLLALVTSGVGYLDRLVALVMDKTTLPLFMLVVMCFSTVQMAVDFFYVSRYRRDFLEQRISLGKAFTSREFLVSLNGGLALAIVASAAVLSFSRNGQRFPIEFVLIIAVLQVSLAVIAIPQQILYWKNGIGRMLKIDLAFWALFGGSALTGWRFDISTTGILLMVATCTVVRLLLYFVAVLRPASSEGPKGLHN